MSEITNEQAWYLLEYISLGDADAIECDDYEFIGCDEFGNEGEYTESIIKIAAKADSYIKELYDQNKQLQSKLAALSIAIADNDIDEVKRLLPLSGEQVVREIQAEVFRSAAIPRKAKAGCIGEFVITLDGANCCPKCWNNGRDENCELCGGESDENGQSDLCVDVPWNVQKDIWQKMNKIKADELRSPEQEKA